MRKLDQSSRTESPLLFEIDPEPASETLTAVGGECLEDLDRLREDPGLAELMGHAIPSPKAARKFLYEFHDGEKIEATRRQRPVSSWETAKLSFNFKVCSE